MSDETKVWRWPGDSPEDKAKRVALSYRALAEKLDPLLVAELDRQWQEEGVFWTVPQIAPPDPDDMLTVAEVAAQTHKSEAAVRMWASRRRSGSDGVPTVRDGDNVVRMRWGDVLTYMARQRQRRQLAGRRMSDHGA